MVVRCVSLVVKPALYKPAPQYGELLAKDPKCSHNKGLKDQTIGHIRYNCYYYYQPESQS